MNEREVWLAFACAALTGRMANEPPIAGGTAAEVAAAMADRMVGHFGRRFPMIPTGDENSE